MPQLRPQAIDGLWQCLCPSFDQTAWRLIPQPSRAGFLTHTKRRTRRPVVLTPHRSIATIIPSHPAVPDFWKPKHIGRPSPLNKKDSCLPESGRRAGVSPGQAHALSYENGSRAGSVLLDAASNDIRTLPTPRIYTVLRSEADLAHLNRVQEIIDILVRERGESPDKQHYYALIAAQANAENGSAAEIERLLQEMQEAKIELDAAICSAVLKGLAIHPHYMLRCHIIQEMESSWYPFSIADHQHVAAGLLRELQFELARDRLDVMAAEGLIPEPWLLSLFLFSFSSINCLQETHDLLKKFLSSLEYRVPPALWSYLLHTAAREQFQPMIRDIWNRAVKSGYINPPSGLCTMVLESCAAHGDTILAADVFDHLSKRSSPLEVWHYESLLEAYTVSGDLEGLLSTIQIMSKAGFPLSHASARSIFVYMQQSEEMVTDILGLISRPSTKRESIPLTLVNAILEAMTHQGNLAAAIDVVHELERLTVEPADCETFNVLLQGCTFSARKDIAMSLAYEMRQKGIVPNTLTYDRLILVCLSTCDKDDFEDAWRYYEELRSSMPENSVREEQRWALRRGTMRTMNSHCIRYQDRRVFAFMDQCSRAGMDVSVLRQNLLKQWEEKWGAGSLPAAL